MKMRLNRFLAALVTLSMGITFIGCAHLQKCEISNHMEDLMPDQPAILATGTPEQIRQTAIADARADIAASRPRIAITGSIVTWPMGVPDKYLNLVSLYPKISLPCGCSSAWLGKAATYAEAYTPEILTYLLSQNEAHD
jgi:hypothetical protein